MRITGPLIVLAFAATNSDSFLVPIATRHCPRKQIPSISGVDSAVGIINSRRPTTRTASSSMLLLAKNDTVCTATASSTVTLSELTSTTNSTASCLETISSEESPQQQQQQSAATPNEEYYQHDEDIDALMRENTANEDNNNSNNKRATAYSSSKNKNKFRRFLRALPGNNIRSHSTTKDDNNLDRTILSTAIPSMINNAVVPIVNSVDTFWVGRMGVALALAGQAAANQAFFTLYFLVNYLPTITAPLVASAVGSGNQEEAKQRVCESLFVGNLLGLIGTIVLVGFPRTALSLVLPEGAPAMEYAAPYLRLRALSMVPTIVAATGFAAYRGLLDTVTPLKVNLVANVLNLILDPLLMFQTPLKFVGAALATAISETTAGITYLRLLIKKGLASVRLLFKPPPLKSLIPLLQGGSSMLGRQAALNFGFVSATRCAQKMDPTGVSAAAYGIVMQLYAIGIVVQVAVQSTAATMIPSTLTATDGGESEARHVADRMFVWGAIVGLLLGVAQIVALPWLVPLFSTLPEVQEAVKRPALLVSVLHAINGLVFVGEGVMLGLGSYKDLMLITIASTTTLVGGLLLSPFAKTLDGIMCVKMAFCAVQAVGVVAHYLRIGPLAVRPRRRSNKEEQNNIIREGGRSNFLEERIRKPVSLKLIQLRKIFNSKKNKRIEPAVDL